MHPTARHLLAIAAAAVIVGALLLAGSAGGQQVDATCQNAATDAATINTAIAASQAGDNIRIHGVCLLVATVKLLGDRTYEGDSRDATILRQADGANLPAVLAAASWLDNGTTGDEPIRIAHLAVDGRKATNSGTVGIMLRSWLSTVEDVEVFATPGDNIAISNPSANGTALVNTMVNGRLTGLLLDTAGGVGLHVIDPGNSVTDWTFDDSWVSWPAGTAVDMDNAAGWAIKGLHLYGIGRHGIDARRCYGTTVESNLVEDFGGVDGGAGNTWYGISCTLQGGSGSTIANNRIFNSWNPKAKSIFLGLQGNYGVAAAAVTGNVIRGNGKATETGLSYAKGGSTSVVLTSTGNNVTNVGTARTVGQGVTVNAGQ